MILNQLLIKLQKLIKLQFQRLENQQKSMFRFSDNDLSLLKNTYRQLSEKFYENPSESSVHHLLTFLNIIEQVIATPQELKKLGIGSMLQVLKAKSRNYQQLHKKTQEVIKHFENPGINNKRDQTGQIILQGIQCSQVCPQLYAACCTILMRDIAHFPRLSFQQTAFLVGTYCTVDMNLSIELLLFLKSQKNQYILKGVLKSGLIKFLLKNYLNTVIQNSDRLMLYRALKLCKFLSQVQKNLLKQRQKSLADVILAYQQYIPITQQILANCFEEDYSNQLYNGFSRDQPDWLDRMYIWSHEQKFCKGLLEKVPICIKKFQQIIQNQKVTEESQTKVYAILANLSKMGKCFTPVPIPPKHIRTLKNAMKLLNSATQQQLKKHKKIDVKKLQKDIERSLDPMVPKLFTQFVEKYEKKNIKIGSLNISKLDIFSQKNAEILIQKASHIPKKADEFIQLIEILTRKYPRNQFQADCLHRAKGLALKSIQQAILDPKKIITVDIINKIIESIYLSDVQQISKLMQLLEVFMLRNPDDIDMINGKKIEQILEWLQGQTMKSKGLVDWGACAQVLNILFGQSEWQQQNNFNDAFDAKNNHKRTFWMLNIPDNLGQDKIKKIMGKLSQIDKNHAKLPLIIGFLSRSNPQIRKLLMLKNNDELATKICNREPQSPNQLLMLSYLIDRWPKQDNEVVKQKISKTIIPSIFKLLKNHSGFNNTDHACKLLNACLPMKPDFQFPYEVISVQSLLSKHGRLTKQLYRSKQIKINKGSIYQKVKSIVGHCSQKQKIPSESIIQILNFLVQAQCETDMDFSAAKEPLNGYLQQLFKILMKLDREYSYWKIYPNYLNIMIKFVKLIVTIHGKNKLTSELIRVFQNNYDFNSTNPQLNEDEYKQIIEEIHQSLEQMRLNCQKDFTCVFPVDIERFKNITQRVKEKQPQLANKIMKTLALLEKTKEERLLIAQQQARKKKQQESSIALNNSYKKKQQNKLSQDGISQGQLKSIGKKQQYQATQRNNNSVFNESTIYKPKQDQQLSVLKQKDSGSMDKQEKSDQPSFIINGDSTPSFQQSMIRRPESNIQEIGENKSPGKFMIKQDKGDASMSIPQQEQNIYDIQKQQLSSEVPNEDSVFILQSQQSKGLSETEINVLQAIKKLKEITEGKQPISLFPKLILIFKTNQIPVKYRDILGHLLAKTYHIRQDSEILDMLLNKQKANISKQPCYQLLNRYFQTFILSRRYKLFGRQWLIMAMERIEQGYIADGCLVSEYNLIKTSDIEFFQSRKYHQQIYKLKDKINSNDQVAYYLLLVGTSCRLNDIRNFYLKNNMHIVSLQLMSRESNFDLQKIIANGNYALSSLVYMQPTHALRVAKQQEKLIKIFKGISKYPTTKSVVESGCCLVSNMTYNNQQVKTILQGYKMIPMLQLLLKANLESEKSQINTFKHVIRAIGNCSVNKACANEILDGEICSLSVIMTEKFDMLVFLNEEKIKVLKLTVDLLANLTVHKYKIESIHKAGVTDLVMTLLQTSHLNHELINGCIDTVDGLCQIAQIQSYIVNKRNLPFILIDILKMQQNEKTITKATRLLTNLTIHPECIPSVLKANLLSILGNIVMTSHFNKKLEAYVSKVLVRVYNSQQPLQLILKSGYLDCLVRAMECSQTVEDVQVDIMLYYSKSLPNFLNKRAFMCMIRVLTQKPTNKQLIQKSIKIFKILLNRSVDRDQEDLVVNGSIGMYQHLLPKYPADMLYLLGSHCLRSKKIRYMLRKSENQKLVNLINGEGFSSLCAKLYEDQNTLNSVKAMIPQVSFIIFNDPEPLIINHTHVQQEKAFQLLKKGVKCKLFRLDGSSKKAIVDMNDDYVLRAYKFPEGQIKKKYVLPIRNIKDWRFYYTKNMEGPSKKLWGYSLFARSQGKGFFDDQIQVTNCVTLIGGMHWGQFVNLNIQFENLQSKAIFVKSLTILMRMFVC